MYILGISAWYHDSAAALIKDGVVIAAAQEERFTRIKHDPGFPTHAVQYCLSAAKIELSDLTAVVFYEKPKRKFNRIWETFKAFAPIGHQGFFEAIPLWLSDKMHQKRNIRAALTAATGQRTAWTGDILFSEHHLSHAASAFYPSPFAEAAVLTLDGVGEWATTSIAHGHGKHLEIIKELHFPHSLGLFYAAFTSYLGFKVNSGEYKVMGLAPYGTPRFAERIMDRLIHVHEDGSFQLNMDYFDFCTGHNMTNQAFADLFEGPPRTPETELSQRDMDIAASIQNVTEQVVCQLGRHVAASLDTPNLTLAGGVALNCVANGILLRTGIFKEIWIQPAAGDAGGALGAALAAYHLYFDQERPAVTGMDGMSGAYLGPSFDDHDIQRVLESLGAVWTHHTEPEMLEKAAHMLAGGQAIGWMQGRMEFGPRALGGRSILADPRSSSMQKQLNLKVKFRESFRPFAPSVLEEDVSKWFEIDRDSPYMLLVANVKDAHRRAMTVEEEALFGIEKLNIPRSTIPSVTHVDYSARIQTVHPETNPRYHALISCFRDLTGCPILVNTSFNVRGEPIVCTPEDAFHCLMGTDLDGLVIGNFVLEKSAQDPRLLSDYRDRYALD